MVRLELTSAEAATLREILTECATDLGMEIAGTDLKDYRDLLKMKKALLWSLVERLETTTAARV